MLGITQSGGSYIAAPTFETRVEAYDTLVVYGEQSHLCEIDQRPAGAPGDEAHDRAVAEHRREVAGRREHG